MNEIAVFVDMTLRSLQIIIGFAVGLGALFLLMMTGECKRTGRRSINLLTLISIIGLMVWACWFIWVPWHLGRHDSIPALAFAAVVAYVLLVNGRQIRGILEGEDWWPKNGAKQ